MANNYGVANTVFKPFSFEEMLKPALMATKSLEELEAEKTGADEAAALSALDFKGSKYENKFNDYLKSLSGVADYINKGDIQNAKRAIKSAKNMYINTLIPAQQRIKRLNTLREKQNTEESANPFVRFDVDYRNKTEDDITTNSSYTSYDLNKIYKQVATDTISRISSEYRPQVGNPIKVSGTNSYLVTHGYGMTQKEYKDARKDKNSDLNKFINSEIKKATSGITNKSIIDEVTQGVKDVIKSNIGKFEQTQIKGSNSSESNANFFRAAEAAYKYNWGTDANGNPIILGESDRYKLDNGWRQDINGEWYKPSKSSSGSGNDFKEEKIDPYFDLKTMPSSKRGTIRIKSTDIDNKLRKESNRPDISVEVKGKKKSGLKKFEWYELNQLGIKGLDANEIAYYADGNIDNAKYYNYYYEDTSGKGGELHMVRKPDAEIEDIIVKDRTTEKRKEIAGITKKGSKYYFTDKNGKILLDPRRFGIQLDLMEEELYKELLKNLKEGTYIPIQKNITKTSSSEPYIQKDSTTVAQPQAEDIIVNL